MKYAKIATFITIISMGSYILGFDLITRPNPHNPSPRQAQAVSSWGNPITVTITNADDTALTVLEQFSGGPENEWLNATPVAIIQSQANATVSLKVPVSRSTKLLFQENNQVNDKATINLTFAKSNSKGLPDSSSIIQDQGRYTYLNGTLSVGTDY